jgi:hypothetical protein
LRFHIADAEDDKVWSESNDLFDDLNEETTSDAVENPEDQEPASDNEDMMDDQLDMEDDKVFTTSSDT